MTSMAATPAQTLTGTAWWTGSQVSSDYTLSGDGTLTLDVEFQAGNEEGYGAFNVELYEPSRDALDRHYITTGSDQNAWYAENATGDDITGIAATPVSTIEVGNTYTIKVTRSGADVTITYLNPDGTTYAEYVAKNTNLGTDLAVHVIAQVGTYEIAQTETITGTEWWSGNQTGSNYTMSGNSVLTLEVAFQKGDDIGYGAFNVELYEPSRLTLGDKHYITTGSDQNAWYAENAAGDDITGISATPASTIEVGKTYTVQVKHLGDDVTITYLNEDGTTYAEYVAANTNLGSDLAIHVIAQVGTYSVKLKSISSIAVPSTPSDDTETPDDSTTNSGTDDTDASGNDGSQDDGNTTAAGTTTSTTTTTTTTTTNPSSDTGNVETEVNVEKTIVADTEAASVEKEATVENLEAAGLPTDTKVAVNAIAETEPVYAVISDFLTKTLKSDKAAAVDLSLETVDGKKVETQPNGKVKVTLPLFDNIKEAKWIAVYRYNDDTKKFDFLDTVEVKDGKFAFETDHFTPYVFASVDAPKTNTDSNNTPTTTSTTKTDTTTGPKTGDAAPVAAFIAMAGVAGAVVVTRRKRA
jgi:hypothetical protein